MRLVAFQERKACGCVWRKNMLEVSTGLAVFLRKMWGLQFQVSTFLTSRDCKWLAHFARALVYNLDAAAYVKLNAECTHWEVTFLMQHVNYNNWPYHGFRRLELQLRLWTCVIKGDADGSAWGWAQKRRRVFEIKELLLGTGDDLSSLDLAHV